jgi:hypothetical protein
MRVTRHGRQQRKSGGVAIKPDSWSAAALVAAQSKGHSKTSHSPAIAALAVSGDVNNGVDDCARNNRKRI